MPEKTEIYHETARGKVNLAAATAEQLHSWRKLSENTLTSLDEAIVTYRRHIAELEAAQRDEMTEIRLIMAELSRREPARREMELVKHAYAGTLEDFLKTEAAAERMFTAKRDEAAPEEDIWGAGSADNADD